MPYTKPYRASQNAHWGVFFSPCTAAQGETALKKILKKIFHFPLDKAFVLLYICIKLLVHKHS